MKNDSLSGGSSYPTVVMGKHCATPPLISQAQAKLLRPVANGARPSQVREIGSGTGLEAAS